jgi:hypothetical protein
MFEQGEMTELMISWFGIPGTISKSDRWSLTKEAICRLRQLKNELMEDLSHLNDDCFEINSYTAPTVRISVEELEDDEAIVTFHDTAFGQCMWSLCTSASIAEDIIKLKTARVLLMLAN